MGDQARVTVVIPAYKAEATIRRAIDSVLAQEGVQLETVVVVDGLLDRTLERLEGYDPERVKVLVNEQNRGAQVSRNRGLEAATGDFVMFLDCDDFVEGPLLEGLAKRLGDEGADIAFGPMQVLKEPSGRRKPELHQRCTSPDELFRSWMGDGLMTNPSAIMWRTEFLRRIGGWELRARRNQDGEVVMRSVLMGARCALSRQGRGIYVIHDSSDRVTKRPENLPSALEVGEFLMAIESTAVSDQARREGFARYFYRIALRLYSLGRPDLAKQAMQRARQMGLDLDLRSAAHRWIAKLIGIPFRVRLFRLDSGGAAAWFLLGIAARNISAASSAAARLAARGSSGTAFG